MTNADRIRNMTDEELAETIPCPHMVNWKKGNYDTCVHPNGKDGCKKCILEWLRSEIEQEEKDMYCNGTCKYLNERKHKCELTGEKLSYMKQTGSLSFTVHEHRGICKGDRKNGRQIFI